MSELVPPGVVCNAEDYAHSLTNQSIHCLTRGESIGLTITAESGLISLCSVLGVLTLIMRNAIRHFRLTRTRPLLHTPTDVLILSLFVADLVQAMGAVMDIRWVNDGKVQVGVYCSAQGIVQQLGETSVAITTLLITIFTFVGVWWRKGLGSTRLAFFLVALVWIFVALFVGIGNATHKDKLYEAPTPYWCWIGQNFLGLRIAGEYVWFWITLLVSLLAYLTLFLWARGNITVSETAWWRCKFHRRGPALKSSPDSSKFARKAAYAMIAYPVSYCILVLPLSIVRWIAFTQGPMPSAATFAVISMYGLSGAVNVALLLKTRPNSVLFGGGDAGRDDDVGRAPSLSPNADVTSTYSEFRVRVPGRGSRESAWRSGDSSRLELGRLPSREDGDWDLAHKVIVVQSQQDDNESRTVGEHVRDD
ncbi:hypothetical protein MSAN_00063300 [Mycena sanguinolenta]|uniref:G-protein coupled receptors family 1 profile domain-containing protein n=1 Tax=Mycena sanguinolenta TaxID=230812 RepID=A0A8H6ZHM3_9AGAR|nr:hypothetical protein MSAN_00063300 [Mycena sanguinolenta]